MISTSSLISSAMLSIFTFNVLFITDTNAIYCYECDSSSNFSCTELWDKNLVDTEVYLTNCKHVSEARYCIKMTGVFEGKLGTKRFCSSKTWGNYCEYIKRPGDIQEYRSCVFSCSGFGCNGAMASTQSKQVLALTIAMLMLFRG